MRLYLDIFRYSVSLSPSFSCQLPAKQSLRQGFRGTRLQRGCFFRKTRVRGWNRIGRGGKGLREGLVWPDWEALESKSSLSKVILPEAEARLLSSRREGTGKRHWKEEGLLPSQLCHQQPWLALGSLWSCRCWSPNSSWERSGPSDKGALGGPNSTFYSILSPHWAPLIIFFPCA